jgi:hypothetical protein
MIAAVPSTRQDREPVVPFKLGTDWNLVTQHQ